MPNIDSTSSVGQSNSSALSSKSDHSSSSEDEETKTPSYKCAICQKPYGSRSGLSYHLNIHRAYNQDVFKCSDCKETFNSLELLDKHKVTHSGENKPFKCTHCGKGFAKKSDQPRHEKICSQNDHRAIECKICKQHSLQGIEGLKLHLIAEHGQEGQEICDKCHNLFHNKGKLNDHILKRKCLSTGMVTRSASKKKKKW